MNFDDPRITAHALGELESEQDRAAVEQFLRDSTEARAEYEELLSFTTTLRRELKAEPDAALTSDQRTHVMAVAQPAAGLNGHVVPFNTERSRAVTPPWYRQHWMPVGIAAVALVGTTIAVLWDRANYEELHLRNSDITNPTVMNPAMPATQSVAPTESLDSLGETVQPEQPADERGQIARRVRVIKSGQDAGSEGGAAPVPLTFGTELALAQTAPSQPTEMPALDALASTRQDSSGTASTAASAPASAARGMLFGDAPAAEGQLEFDRKPVASAGGRSGSSLSPVRQSLADLSDPAQSTTVGGASRERLSSSISDGSKPESSALRLLVETPKMEGSLAELPISRSKEVQPAPPQMPLSVGRATRAMPKQVIAGADQDVPAAPANALADSENEYLGKDYKMRNFRKETESRQLYALVPGNPLPGLQPQAPQQPENEFYYRVPVAPQESNTEAYDAIQDNPFLTVQENPLSTFSIDVDTASYANVRRFLMGGNLPPKGAVRIEEMVNYFTYDYPQPQGADPFSSTLEVATCPWEPKHRLVRIGLKGRELRKDQRPPSNLVFLIDVSGSMQPQNKLPLVKDALLQMIAELGPKDTVGITVYAGSSGIVLEPTSDRDAIRAALARLESGGSTNGASGIQLAYDLAQRSFIKEGNNRVVLATDGDFNVGVTSRSELVELIEKRAKAGVFLTVLGFGFGNLKDSTLEQLADKGNGNYAYIDTIREGRKVLVEQMAGTLFTIAKDVKIQVEFNPAQVSAYRLIGYENRLMKKEDFNDDKKDAGEIGAGHTVTALYQVVPTGVAIQTPGVDPLKYQSSTEAPRLQTGTPAAAPVGGSKEMLTLKLRAKQPDGDTSTLREFPLTDAGLTWERSSRDFRFAAAVASFGMLLRDSPHKGSTSWATAHELAIEGKGEDAGGYRQEFIGLLEKARSLQAK